jgi:hypothetical protein
MMRESISILVVAIVLTFVGTSAADITINGFTDETNDRFTNSSSFIGAQFDFSGVGRRNGWATLISPNVLVTANHAPGTAPNAYRFYPGNDPTATPVIRTEASRLRLAGQGGNSDLLLIALSEPVTSEIAYYNFADELIEAPAYDADTNPGLFAAGSFQGEEAYVFGLSPTDRTPNNSAIDQAVGRNRITGYIEEITFGAFTDSLLLQNDAQGSGNFVQYETLVQAGDSGAPVFVERDGELVLLGTNSFRSGTDFSGVTYLGNYADQIDAFIALNSVEPTVTHVALNAGEAQRSAVESISITFDGDVVLAEGAAALVQRSTATEETFDPVMITTSQQTSGGQTVVTVLFDSHVRNSDNALVDGNYQLTLVADLVTLNGFPMSQDFVFGAEESDGFFAYYADSDGNRHVNVFDLLALRQTFGAFLGDGNYDFSMDFDASGSVNVIDLLQFRIRFGNSIPFTFGSALRSFQNSDRPTKPSQAVTVKPSFEPIGKISNPIIALGSEKPIADNLGKRK